MSAPYFDMRTGQVIQDGRPVAVRPEPALAGPVALGQNGGGAGKTLLWLAVLGGLGYGAYYLYKRSQEEGDEEEERERESEAGYWVKLYNYPRGAPDRRLKQVEGPFDTRTEATEVAREHEDAWYPVVAWSVTSPLEAER